MSTGACSSTTPMAPSVRTSATYSLGDGFPTRVEVVRQTGNDGDLHVMRETYEWLRIE